MNFPEGFDVRIATDTDFIYLMSLQRANRESVGGLPGPALQQRIDRRAAFLGLLNGEPCGYLLCDKGRDRIMRIPQACIQYDETDYMRSAPEGFIDGGSLGKLAWANRKLGQRPLSGVMRGPVAFGYTLPIHDAVHPQEA